MSEANRLIDFRECMEKGLIRKTAPSREQALLALDKAEEAFGDSKANLEDGRHDATVTLAYVCLLNASKAILLKDGFQEKSHVCIIRYLEAKHLPRLGKETIRALDSFRETRHDVQYSASFRASESQAKEIVGFAKSFLSEAGDIVRS